MRIPAPYLRKIREIYPDVALDHVLFNSDGMVNDVVVINGALVCRFVKDQGSEGQLIGEAAVLSVVNDWVDLATPRLDHLDPGFVSYRCIPGAPLSRSALAKLSARGRARIISELGVFHQQLHGIPADALAAVAHVPRSASEHTRADWVDLFHRVQQSLFPHLWSHQKAWVEELFAPVVAGQLELDHQPTLIHGDLAIYHIFHDPETETLTGVIDFGVAGIGDPACDIAVQLSNYGDDVVRKMAAAYPALLDVIDRARFWAGTFELQWATAGLQNNDLSLLLAHIGGKSVSADR